MVCCLPTYIPTLHYIILHYITSIDTHRRHHLNIMNVIFGCFVRPGDHDCVAKTMTSPAGSSNGNFTVNLFCEKQGQIQISVEVLNFAWFLVSMTISSLFLFSCGSDPKPLCFQGDSPISLLISSRLAPDGSFWIRGSYQRQVRQVYWATMLP